MSLPEGELEGEEEGPICEGVIGGGGVRRGSLGNVQHEFGSGSEICGDSPGDDGEDQGFRTQPGQKRKVIRISGDQGGGNQGIRESG